MVEKPKATPVGNEARDAASALGGFVYQIYQTAWAWLDLPAGEFLFVEAGEDYVVAAQEALSGTQVKETSAAVTINSDGIVASINSFVELRTKNLGLSVSLRHLTTSAITLEKAATDRLGSEPTLILWKRLAKLGDIAPLRKILMASKVSADSKRFIASLNDDEFREEFLRRIHFDCGAPGATFIKRQVVARLQALIIKRGGLGSQAESCFSQVFLLLLEKAASPGERHQRCLDRPGLENIIEQATHVSVRRSEYENLTTVKFGITATGKSPFTLSEPTRVDQIPLPAALAQRTTPMESIVRLLSEHGIAWVMGGSGVGKTVGARMAAKRIGGDWIGANFRGQNTEQAAVMIAAVIDTLIEDRSVRGILLDDLDCRFDQNIVDQLLFLKSVLDQSHSLIIVTASKPPPSDFLFSAAISSEIDLRFSEFTKDDIGEILEGLVSRLRDYDGLVYAQNWQVLRRDEKLDAPCHTRLLLDQSDFLKCL